MCLLLVCSLKQISFTSSEKCDEDNMGHTGSPRREYPVECDSVDIQPASNQYQQYKRRPDGAEQHWSHIGEPSPSHTLAFAFDIS
jgi:hypothetical protein